jgi:DNA polymerase III epsilon subunit family exonuclease
MTERAPTSLVRHAAERLGEGPTHTLDLARDVLGLSGHPGAAAAAVFQLLGSDPRFRVDADGVWSLDPGLVPLGRSLADVPFAVVDVETTGGGLGYGHRIIEFAVVEVHDGRIVDEFETLVNPGRPVPGGVTALTGITNGMVAGAPYFDHVAEEIFRRLEGRVFVAHNVTFDWSFVSAELVAALGSAPTMPLLCTVRMVRRFVPSLRRRNLDEVTRHFGVRVHARHRAHGDALATARVLLRLLDEARGRGLDDFASLEWYLRRRSRRGRKDPRQTTLDLRANGGGPHARGSGRR